MFYSEGDQRLTYLGILGVNTNSNTKLFLHTTSIYSNFCSAKSIPCPTLSHFSPNELPFVSRDLGLSQVI